jgi:predicted nucleic acid-binding Zn ribbon protein
MPMYCFVCECGHTAEYMNHPIGQRPKCPKCETLMNRDYKAENVTPTWHISRDLYAESKRPKS